MAKLKLKNAIKFLKGDIAFKKLLANFIADSDMLLKNQDLREILMVGHRGYMALSEDDLCKLFEESVADLQIKNGASDNTGYYRNDSYSKLLREADEIYNVVFEKMVLAGEFQKDKRVKLSKEELLRELEDFKIMSGLEREQQQDK